MTKTCNNMKKHEQNMKTHEKTSNNIKNKTK